MTEAKPRVFLSYARADRPRVAKIAEALTAAGLSVWWDTAIEGGASFSADIERELDAADVVVVVWSARSIKSDWVRDEAGAGRTRNRLVPVQIDATLPPLGFRQLQSIDLSGWKGRAGDAKFAALVSAIHKLAVPVGVVAVAKASPASCGPSRRVLIGGSAGVAALAAGGFGAWKLLAQKSNDGTASIVVLPFANLSGDPAQAFFSDGIAEELRNALSQIPGLKVIGGVSSERFRDSNDLSAAAEKLGVDHVLTGSVRRSPTRIRIGAQLIDGRTGVERWSQSYDQPAGDALAIQGKIATSIVTALSATLGKAAGTIVVGGTSNPAAQELFLKAGELFREASSEANNRKQLAFVDAAIALDPSYADAWARRSSLKANQRYHTPAAADWPALINEGMVAGQRAVALAPKSGFARISLAGRYSNLFDFRRAIAEGETAHALAPQDGRVLRNFALFLWSFDPDRGVGLTRDAVETNLLNPFFISTYAQALYTAHQFQTAVEVALQLMTLTENRSGAATLVTAYLALGQTNSARANLQFIPSDWLRATYLAIVEARAGNRAASDAAFAALRSNKLATNYLLAIAHAQRGETSEALAAIDMAIRDRHWRISELAFDPLFDPLRKEPRFKALQAKIIPTDILVPLRS